jgi:hypothetical protein
MGVDGRDEPGHDARRILPQRVREVSPNYNFRVLSHFNELRPKKFGKTRFCRHCESEATKQSTQSAQPYEWIASPGLWPGVEMKTGARVAPYGSQ